MTESHYKGRIIQLLPAQKEDGTWLCRYLVVENETITSGSLLGHHELGFSTRRAAQSAALKAAKELIDSNGPLDDSLSDGDDL